MLVGQDFKSPRTDGTQLVDLIKDEAVALRLIAGSDEAGYLSQIFPLPQTPTMVIMKHGELKEYLTPNTTKEDFLRRVRGAFNPSSQTSSSNPQSTPATTSASNSPPASSHAETVADTHPSTPQQSENVRRILAERAARLQAQREEDERKVREERSKAKEKAKEEAAAGANTDAARAHKQAELVKKRRQQEQEERQRILKRIQDDKAERRLRAAEREQQRLESQTAGDVAASLVNAPETKLSSTTKIGEMAYLQMRLFDGSTIRSRFKTGSSLRDVRTWVDKNRTDGKDPYTFKHVLTPLANKTIDETEEDKALGELGLVPSATLVLIPVTKYSSAYANGNIFSQLMSMILGFFTWLLGLVGLGRRAEPVENSSSDAASASTDRSRIRGFQNSEERRRDQQLYNGNSVSTAWCHSVYTMLTSLSLTLSRGQMMRNSGEDESHVERECYSVLYKDQSCNNQLFFATVICISTRIYAAMSGGLQQAPPIIMLKTISILVLAGSSLAGLELLEVPAADLHVATLLIHALGELDGGALAVVVAELLLVLRGLRLDGGLLGGFGGAAKETAEGVADGRANSDTARYRQLCNDTRAQLEIVSERPGAAGHEPSGVETSIPQPRPRPVPPSAPQQVFWKNSRSSAGHLAKQTRALRAGLSRRGAGLLAVLLLGSGHGGVGAALLLRRGSRDGRADGSTRRSAAGGSVARHDRERGGLWRWKSGCSDLRVCGDEKRKTLEGSSGKGRKLTMQRWPIGCFRCGRAVLWVSKTPR